MSYKVMLVDDEPIILSGIKSLINWEENNCTIIQTARNGKDALALIAQTIPDIVLCDINMPVMDGIAFLKQVNTQYPYIAVILLTNLEDFYLVQKSMRYHAIDYLLKSQLEPAALEKSLETACKEFVARKKLNRIELADSISADKQTELVQGALLKLANPRQNITLAQPQQLLHEHHMLSCYACLYLPLDFFALPQFGTFTDTKEERLFAWQYDVVNKIAQNFFDKFFLFSPTAHHNSLFLFCYALNPADWDSKVNAFSTRVRSTSLNVTGAQLSVLATHCFKTSQLETCRAEILTLYDIYYQTSTTHKIVSTSDQHTIGQLSLNGISNEISIKIRAKDIAAITRTIDVAINQFRTIQHTPQQALWLCQSLFESVCSAFEQLPESTAAQEELLARSSGQRKLNHLLTRESILIWLEALKQACIRTIGETRAEHLDVLEHARQYIRDNLDKRILLADIASHVAISPSYLSTTFKKQFNCSVVDYINQEKIKSACQRMENSDALIYEVSADLGFDNAYYFTKVFKQHTGMTPTEYRYQLKKAEDL